ncbi:glycoside hydrolase family 15 protein [Nocardioides bruguierae]|uniref:Glycoside hydrolase family 15 protein n=1 Tax=Nocardioides bruguierae TaxID=2945102 RepID=A0A9X2D8M0_9ACTN|nr:glycoside hydrolase family 15 protein [Nocardioides bruguierae]MCM0621166.1 glycoside hydrolase family 15 protein [Nocardioides bruguierae]
MPGQVDPAPRAPRGEARDDAGFADLGRYGVLGDGRGVALVGPDASVDWWATPDLDSPPTFAALLDPERGGALRICPDADVLETSARYLPGTNVLETTLVTASGTLVVLDALDSGRSGPLPWSELARRLTCTDGEVTVTLEIAPGDGLRAWQPWVEETSAGVVVHAGPTVVGLRVSDEAALHVEHRRVLVRLHLAAGERTTVGLVASEADPVFLCDVASVDARLDHTVESWRSWGDSVVWEGPERDRMVRSGLALKTLFMTTSGAIAAAATTSLPERVGGEKNWDYRFTWVRDAAMTIDALAALGLEEEVHAAMRWLLHAIRDHGPDVQVLYTLDGDVPTALEEPDVPGYRGSRPVQRGNRATGQLQLGVYGHLFGAVLGWVERGHVLDPRTQRELSDLADICADRWRTPDAGIWELEENQHWTSSAMSVWHALECAATLADRGQLHGDGRRWHGEAEAVRAWVWEHCWSEVAGAWAARPGTDDLDASVLLGAITGFDRSERMSSTLDAVGQRLGVEGTGLLYRYTGAEKEEETFLACAFWRVHALALLGRADEARDLLSSLDHLSDPEGPGHGLLAEMATPDGVPTGNLPQALSHLALIGATAALRVVDEGDQPAVPVDPAPTGKGGVA